MDFNEGCFIDVMLIRTDALALATGMSRSSHGRRRTNIIWQTPDARRHQRSHVQVCVLTQSHTYERIGGGS